MCKKKSLFQRLLFHVQTMHTKKKHWKYNHIRRFTRVHLKNVLGQELKSCNRNSSFFVLFPSLLLPVGCMCVTFFLCSSTGNTSLQIHNTFLQFTKSFNMQKISFLEFTTLPTREQRQPNKKKEWTCYSKDNNNSRKDASAIKQ